jgi:ParB-like nuclease domain
MSTGATLKSTENGYAASAQSIASIPLNKLTAWNGNVRKTGANEGLSELTASIAAHGVLQSLIVRKTNRGKFAVVAGRRRFLALSALAEGGTITPDAPIPCRVIPGSADATEISLTSKSASTRSCAAWSSETAKACTSASVRVPLRYASKTTGLTRASFSSFFTATSLMPKRAAISAGVEPASINSRKASNWSAGCIGARTTFSNCAALAAPSLDGSFWPPDLVVVYRRPMLSCLRPLTPLCTVRSATTKARSQNEGPER